MTETIRKGNTFEMLGSMNTPEELTDNMRNPVEINRLVTATRSALKEQTIVYPDPNSKAKISESFHQITEIPSLYEIPYTEGKVELKILLMFLIRKFMNENEIGNQFDISHAEDLTETKDIKSMLLYILILKMTSHMVLM